MEPSAAQSGSGALPFRLWIGVSGHRHLPDDRRLADSVRQALDRARQLVPSSGVTPVRLGIVSALAEGADRLLAREVLRDPEAVLQVVLPLPPDEYLRDFATETSKDDFHDLLGRASLVTELPPAPDRDRAYALAGRYVDDHSDVLVAVWDGEGPRGTGGTAEIVMERDHERKPLLLVSSTEPYTLSERHVDGLRNDLEEVFRGVDDYNRRSLSSDHLAAEMRRRGQSMPVAGLDEPQRTSLRWWLPYLARAHRLTHRFQRLHRLLGVLLALGAALAVALAASALFGESTFAPWLEALILVLLVVALRVGRRLRAHQRWISYRSLAERLRAAQFLALAGLGAGPSGGGVRRDTRGPLAWVGWAVDDLWAICPRGPDPPESAPGPLRRFLADAWIREQHDYHLGVARRYERLDKWFTLAIYLLFSVTVVAALVHAMRDLGDDWSHRVTYVSVVLPALAGALEAIRAQRQWLPNKERSKATAEALEGLAEAMEQAPDATAIRAIARDVAIRTLEESSAWLGLMRFHDLELS